MRSIVSEVKGLEGLPALGASARSQLYLLFSDSFHVPDEEFYTDLKSGALKQWIQGALGRLPYQLAVQDSVELLDAAANYEEFNSEYMRLFELGPLCPLYESQYTGGQATVFEELVSFYNFFGLTAAQARELPDHLRIELDFMHFLTFKEAESLHSGADPGSFVRAERDFLQRHLGRWAPLLSQKAEQFARLDFFKGLTKLVSEFIHSECAWLQDSA